MKYSWTAFYWRDYIGDTGHLTLAQHGAYLLLMAHYYTTAKPIPANASILHRICRCTNDADRQAAEEVVKEFFTLDGEVYRNSRCDHELAKRADISGKRSTAANTRHQKTRDANAPANAVQMHTQPQPQTQETKSKACARPTLEEVTAYCRERANLVNPQQWFDHYSSNGWKVGRNPMKDWKAAVRNWEQNGVNHANGHGNGNRAQQRQADNLEALEAAFPLDR